LKDEILLKSNNEIKFPKNKNKIIKNVEKWNISVSIGKKIKKDFVSSGERKRKKPSQDPNS